jgi:uncharacterized protein (TIGR00251 family)
MAFQVKADPQGACFELKVQPGAGRTAITGVWENALKMKVAKKPEDGAANLECLAYLAKKLGVTRRSLVIVKGEFSHHKAIRVIGLSPDEVLKRLMPDEQ